jgi:hypothetical protein
MVSINFKVVYDTGLFRACVYLMLYVGLHEIYGAPEKHLWYPTGYRYHSLITNSVDINSKVAGITTGIM